MKRSEIDNSCNSEIVCPWCGCEFSDSWEFADDSGDSECGECEKVFFYERYVDVSYSTYRDCDQIGEEHDFQYDRHVIKYNNDRYECTKCDKYHYIPHGEEFDVSKSVFG